MNKNLVYDLAIAKFMGWKIDNSFPDKDRVWRSPKGDLELDTTFKFSIDWNKLMPVYEAVNALEGYSVSILPDLCSIYHNGELDWEAPHKEPVTITTFEAVYKCLGGFILKYNQTKDV